MKSETATARPLSKSRRDHTLLKTASVVALSGMAFASALGAQAQTAQETAAGTTPSDSTVVVVTGFRASLQSAISAKKKEDSIVDVIKSSDIAAFPDLNLAESIQRIPGVSIDRDGGEGRTITVRGLNPDFTLVRINDFDAQATTGGRDVTGGANRSRGVDFNVFASELFNGITVRKSTTAEEDEGSLGAIVDLDTPHPFDFKGFTFGAQATASYNDLDHKSGPRLSMLVSNRWDDGKLGASLAVTYDKATIEEEGANTTRWEDAFTQVTASSVGHFASIGDSTGTTFITDCTAAGTGTCSPTTGGSAANLATSAAVNSALHPRIPRYTEYLTDEKRLGLSGSFQAKPTPDTTLTLDGVYSNYASPRTEYDLEAIGLSRNGQGLPASSIYNYTIDPTTNTITKASFNNMDIRAEHRFDDLDTQFAQLDLVWDQKIGDKFSFKASIAGTRNVQDDRQQSTFTVESYNVNGYSYDFTNSEHPSFTYGTSQSGCQINQPCYWSYGSSTATTTSSAPNNTSVATSTNNNGDASLIRLRPYIVTNSYGESKFDAKYLLTDNIVLKAGISFKKFGYTSIEYGRVTTDPTTRDESANTSTGPLNDQFVATVNANIAQYIEPVTIAGTNFYAMNLNALESAFDYTCNCKNAYGTFTTNSTNSSSRLNHKSVIEDDGASYLQMDYDFDVMKMPVRGNLGVRDVTTDETVNGYVSTTYETIKRHYSNILPAFNVSVQPWDTLYVRFAAAQTVARPALAGLAPGGSITTSTQTIGSASAPLGNPYLNPIKSNNLDLNFEWYPDKDGLLSVGFFRKDIKTYIQTVATTEPFSDTGYDPSILASGQTGATPYVVYTSVNTPGGVLNGYEINFQHPFTFLPDYIPGFFHHFGVLANYSNIASKINYVLSTSSTLAGGATNTYGLYNLLGMSPIAWNGTLYYADKKWDARVSLSARSDYLSLLNPGSSVFAQGKHGTRNVDTQVTYALTPHFTLVFEGLNLTNQYNQLYDIYNIKYVNTAGTAGVPASVTINNPNAQLEYDQTGRTFYLGARYKY